MHDKKSVKSVSSSDLQFHKCTSLRYFKLNETELLFMLRWPIIYASTVSKMYLLKSSRNFRNLAILIILWYIFLSNVFCGALITSLKNFVENTL